MTIFSIDRTVGVYIRRLDKRIHGTPKQAAKKAADHGIRHVAIMGAWQQRRSDGKVRLGAPNKDLFRGYVEEFAEAGVSCGLWFYPWAGHEEVLLDALHSQIDKISEGGVVYLLNDAELGYKWKLRSCRGASCGLPRDQVEKAARKLAQGLDALSADHGHSLVGFTSYGLASGHRNFPWGAFLSRAEFVSPQLYTVDRPVIASSLRQWREISNDSREDVALMVPSIATYGKKSGAAMHDHLSEFVTAAEDVHGFIAWSWRQTSADEWRALARWADWMERSLCSEW